MRLGETAFRITDVVEGDPSLSTSGTALAPKVYIGQGFIAGTGLIARGSRISHALLVKLPPEGGGTPSEADVVRKLRPMLRRIAPGELRVRTHTDASEELSRLLIYLNDYLGLVALVALFLSALGAAYLYRSFLGRRTKDIAILLSIGGSVELTRRVYLAQLVLLGLAASMLTAVLMKLLVPLMPLAFGNLVPKDMPVAVPAASLALAVLMGAGGSVLFCWPLLLRLGGVKPATLFQEAAQPPFDLSRRALLAWLPALVVYWGLAVWQAHSLRTGSLFIGLFLGCGLVLTLVGLALVRALARVATGARHARRFALEMAALNLARHRAATLACFLAISLGAMLLNVIPQVRVVLDHELSQPSGERLPSLFLIDTQDEQVEPLQAKLAALGTRLAFLSPLVRARLSTLKGRPVGVNGTGEPVEQTAQTREDEQESRMQNRGYNLSYRAELSSSEELVAGRPFSGRYDEAAGKPAEISVEVDFANRLGVGLGDRMGFDVQGVEVEGEIVSLRRVRWTSFQPNFFVLFQPGVLDEAPKSYVAAIPELARGGDELAAKVRVQTELVRAFPNISIIDVGNTVSRILDIIAQISAALAFMAGLSLIAGIAVLFAIASYQAQQRMHDTTLLKVLGAGFGRLRAITMTEFGLLGAAAAGLGAAISVGVSWALSTYLFESPWTFAWRVPIGTGAAVTALCILTGLAATGRVLRARPALLLDENRG
jgi:putative ABC transport system permease protein